MLVGAGERIGLGRESCGKSARGRGSPGGRVRCDDAPVVIGCYVRLVHEVVETTELLARGLARLHRGRRVPLAKDFLPLRCAGGGTEIMYCVRGALRGIDRRVRAFACDRARLG